MCGIAGCAIHNLNTAEVDSLAKRFIHALKHRGPDGHGYWASPESILLTHTRLSIQDLSDLGKQPMHSASSRFVITFNGEIYNFLELRAELEKQGVRFRGHSDTEVILALAEAVGIPAALEKINGMFAIALYDRESGELTLARDRMGEKPLFYGWVNDQFVFASELKAVRSLQRKLAINADVIGDFLALGYVPTPHSIYRNIFKLVPGSYLTLTPDDLRHCPPEFSPHADTASGPKRYWDLETFAKGTHDLTNPSEAVDQLHSSLRNAIEQQLVADVPVGCFLSGGIDSTLVTALAQSRSSTPINTFTIGFDDPQFDEARYASQIAEHLGTNHHETYISSDDALGIIGRLPEIYDEPFADPSQLPSVLVSAIARKDVTVCLSGDGGDELFAGYNRYTSTNGIINKVNRIPEPLRRRLAHLLQKIDLTWVESLLPYISRIPGLTQAKQANVALKARKLGWLMQATTNEEIYLFLLRFNGLQPDPKSHPEILEKRIGEAFADKRDFLSTVMLLDQLNYLVDDNLMKVDRSAMSVSLETRLPLLDRSVVEMSWRIHPSLKLRDGQSKWPLRQVLYKHVPRQLMERPKMGFSVPLARWLTQELRQWGSDLIGSIGENNVINESFYQLLWEEHLALKRDNSLQLWPALMLLDWISKTEV